MVKFEDYQKKCPWKYGRWCKPAHDTIGIKCKASDCPFWCLRHVIKRSDK